MIETEGPILQARAHRAFRPAPTSTETCALAGQTWVSACISYSFGVGLGCTSPLSGLFGPMWLETQVWPAYCQLWWPRVSTTHSSTNLWQHTYHQASAHRTLEPWWPGTRELCYSKMGSCCGLHQSCLQCGGTPKTFLGWNIYSVKLKMLWKTAIAR